MSSSIVIAAKGTGAGRRPFFVLGQGDGGLGARTRRDVAPELGKPNQNAYIESFNRLRDECLNEHWFPGLLHARTLIKICRREQQGTTKEVTRRNDTVGLCRQLANEADTVNLDAGSNRC